MIVEAASVGTPSVVVSGPENAASELIEEGVNGFVAGSAEPEELADALVKAVAGGAELRESTLEWYERHRDELSIEARSPPWSLLLEALADSTGARS